MYEYLGSIRPKETERNHSHIAGKSVKISKQDHPAASMRCES
jgi:hypothetical protein